MSAKAALVLFGSLVSVSMCDARHALWLAFHHGAAVSPSFNTALMAKASKKKKKSTKKASAGVKGFGSSTSSSKDAGNMDRSKEAMAFYDYMETNGAGDNLKRVSLGSFPLPGTNSKIRGVMALKDIKKGDAIISIPYEMALNLGQEGGDPTLPGVELLQSYCKVLRGESIDTDIDHSTYFKMLPECMGTDSLGSTDFFSEEALESLQSPLVKEETLLRRELTKKRFQQDVSADFPSWIDGTPVNDSHLQWAVWLITSRVLTVQGQGGKSYRLLIPFLDMCNHDRSSPHVLTGLAVPGGELKVVAGANVKAGEQVNICYGGGVAGNDRFLQDYGFLDSNKGFDIVAQQLLGKRRILEGGDAGKKMMSEDQERSLEALRATSMGEDEELLKRAVNEDVRTAIAYRLGVKRALSGYILIQ